MATDDRAGTVPADMDQASVTEAGNPAKPTGAYGAAMLRRMNESHGDVTDWALDYLDFDSSDNVLDVGCGGGATLARLAARMGEGSGRVTGVDHSEVACAESRAHNAAAIEAGRVRVVCASVDDLPFPDSSFDVVTTVESFYFWPTPEKSLAEVRRVLSRGGRFLLVADIYDKPDLGEEARANIERYGLNVPTPEQYRALFSAAGFASCEVHTHAGTDWICVEGVA